MKGGEGVGDGLVVVVVSDGFEGVYREDWVGGEAT